MKQGEVIAMWTKPSYQDIRLGFEITMYFKSV
ncbi:MAG: pyrroloquinoline quinone precursor peptide PqqA [Pseudomonadota bacterium]